MDFTEEIVKSWARQDKAIQMRTAGKQTQAAAYMNTNDNNRSLSVMSSGSFAYAPTVTNADLSKVHVQLGAGLLLAPVAT